MILLKKSNSLFDNLLFGFDRNSPQLLFEIDRSFTPLLPLLLPLLLFPLISYLF